MKGRNLRERACVRQPEEVRTTEHPKNFVCISYIMFERPEVLVLNILLFCVMAVQENSNL